MDYLSCNPYKICARGYMNRYFSSMLFMTQFGCHWLEWRCDSSLADSARWYCIDIL